MLYGIGAIDRPSVEPVAAIQPDQAAFTIRRNAGMARTVPRPTDHLRV